MALELAQTVQETNSRVAQMALQLGQMAEKAAAAAATAAVRQQAAQKGHMHREGSTQHLRLFDLQITAVFIVCGWSSIFKGLRSS